MALLDADDLTECERRVALAARAGELVDLRATADDDPSTGAEWGPERTVRADVLYQLLVVEPGMRAVVLRAARISGGLNLEAATLRCPLILEGCFFEDAVNLRQARAEAIRLAGCHLTCVEAAQLETRGDLQLNRSTATVIDLSGARLGGQLLLEGVSLRGGSWPLELAGTTIAPFDDVTLDGERLERVAFVANGLRVDGPMLCRWGFVAEGEVRLLDAHIQGILDFDGARITNAGAFALNAEGVKVDGPMLCRGGFVAEGHVHLLGAHIQGSLDFDGAQIANPGAYALNAQGVKVDGPMLCRWGFVAEGEVNLFSAHIRGSLEFDGAQIANPGAYALNAEGVKVDGFMYCRGGFAAEGEVRLFGAHVQGQLDFDDARLTNGDGIALNLYEARVLASLRLCFDSPPEGSVSLTSARVGALYDSESTWPAEVHLRGFTYDHLEAVPNVGVKTRLRWVKRDPEGYAPQPYEQLIAFYRQAGQDPDARAAGIEKQRRRRGTLPPLGKAWSIVLGGIVGHGYRAWLAGLWLIALWGIGIVLFAQTYPAYFKPAKPADEIPPFNALLYSLDVILPVIDIKQEAAWIAEGPAQLGALLTIAGWALATTAIAALTGLLKKE